MPLTLIEPIADLVLSELQANLPAKIAALQPTFNPVLAMDPPVEYVFDDTNEFVKGFPSVQVRQVRTPIPNDDLRWQNHAHRLEVGVWIANSMYENLSRLLDRYTRCVLEVLHERRKAGAFYDATGFDLRLDGEEISYTPTLPQTGQFARGVFVPMRFENRGVERA